MSQENIRAFSGEQNLVGILWFYRSGELKWLCGVPMHDADPLRNQLSLVQFVFAILIGRGYLAIDRVTRMQELKIPITVHLVVSAIGNVLITVGMSFIVRFAKASSEPHLNSSLAAPTVSRKHSLRQDQELTQQAHHQYN